MPADAAMAAVPESALTALGFTNLESLAYCELLRHGPASGYRLSQLLGKAPANVYQTLNSLAQKGAVITSDEANNTRIYSPLPPRDLVGRLRRSFDRNADGAVRALQGLHRPISDERVHTIANAEQVIDRAREMLEHAREVVLLDFFPQIQDLLAEEIASARARGLTVAGIAYEERHAGPNMPLNLESRELINERWPGLGVILIVDGREFLIAQLSRDMTDALDAVWSDNVFLSCILHSAVAADIRLTALRLDPSDPLRMLSLQRSEPPGLRTVLAYTSDSDRTD